MENIKNFWKKTDWKKVGLKLLFPPVWLMIILTIISIAALILVFLKGWEESVIAYVSYVIAFYTLTVVVTFFVKVFPGYYKSTKQKIYDNPLGNKYMTDVEFKVRISLYISLGINILYSVFKLTSGIYFSSFWWGAVAVYYIILSVIRFLLLRYMRKDNKHVFSEWKSYRLCGIFMVLINLSLSGIIFQMVVENRAYVYPEVIIITSATYTFYIVTMSIIDIIRYRKYESPVISASKVIRFAAALVSLLTMETTMLARYGEDEGFRQLMVALTGAGVSIIILAMSIYMIIKANKSIKDIRINNS